VQKARDTFLITQSLQFLSLPSLANGYKGITWQANAAATDYRITEARKKDG